MSTATKFDRATCRTIATEAEEALKAVAEKFGLTLKRENGRFTTDSLTTKFTFGIPASDGSGAPADFARKARAVGAPEDCFGKTFTTYSGTYKVTGINLRAKKYHVLAKSVDTDKIYKFPASAIKFGLEKAA